MRRISFALALVVGIAAAGVLAGCGGGANLVVTSSFKGNKGGPRTIVTLVKQPDGSCQATDGVGVLGGQKNSKVTWYVSNYCDTTQYLTFTHYQERIDATTFGPVETNVIDPDPKYYDKLDPGDEDKKVEAKIIKDNTSGKNKTYKYWICVGSAAKPMTNCLDPDVDVWPF